MLKLKMSSLCLDAEELMEIERIILDDDLEGALRFVRKLHAKLEASQVRCGDKK